MKRSILLFFSVTLIGFAQAQEQGQVRFQAAADYKLRIKDFGANVGFEYFFVDKLSLAPNFTFWFPRIGNMSNLNVDARYYLTEGVSQVYLLGGYNNYWINSQPGAVGTVQTRSGGNFGIGAFVRLIGRLGLNTEFKIQSQNSREPVLRFGVVYSPDL